ncbi:hypothetical protein REPUB_Repub08aG0057400 [Reevesia pubescens]
MRMPLVEVTRNRPLGTCGKIKCEPVPSVSLPCWPVMEQIQAMLEVKEDAMSNINKDSCLDFVYLFGLFC